MGLGRTAPLPACHSQILANTLGAYWTQHQTPKQTNLYYRHIIKVTRFYIIYIGDTRSVCSHNFVIKISSHESPYCALTWFSMATPLVCSDSSKKSEGTEKVQTKYVL